MRGIVGRARVGVGLGLAVLVTAAMPGLPARASGPNVLLVGPPGTVINHTPAQYNDIQAAVDAARPGDWVLVAPGDYKASTLNRWGDGVWIGKAIHLRGLDRNGVVIDGTRSGPTCSSAPGDQGPPGNGVEVVKGADGTTVENLTVCNYLGGRPPSTSASYSAGNEIFFNGADASGNTTNLTNVMGRYLTATTTFAYPNGTQPDGSVPSNNDAKYGIFASHVYGPDRPGTYANLIDHTYVNNMADSSYYVGACPNCGTVLSNGWAENSAIGYSGTNAGGNLDVTGNEFDGSRAGIVPNSLNNDDAPSPQDGRCPGTATRCTFFEHNLVHDNNNPDAPGAGIAGSAPTGSGIELVGSQYDTVRQNTVYRQSAWGVIVHDYPDTEPPPPSNGCSGGIPPVGPNPVATAAPAWPCYFQAVGNRIEGNTFWGNGGFGQVGNADLGNQSSSVVPGNCFTGNTNTAGPLTSDPPEIQTVDGRCDTGPAPGDPTLAVALICDSGLFGPCPNVAGAPVANYPQQRVGQPTMIDFQTTLARAADTSHNQGSMPAPCAGVPWNPWCP